MPAAQSADDLRRDLKRRGVHLNTLHALLRLVELDTRKRTYQNEREGRILKFVAMLGGIREPDLVGISRLSQPTLWRLVEHWRTSGVIRVVTDYNDHVVGRRAKWLQPPESPDLPNGRRAYLVETAAVIKAYIPLWETEQVAQKPASAPEHSAPPASSHPKPGSDDSSLPPVLQCPAPPPAPIVASGPRTPPAVAPSSTPKPPPVAPLEASPRVTVVPAPPVLQQAPALTRPRPVASPEPLPVAPQSPRPYVPPPAFVQGTPAPPPVPSYNAPQVPIASSYAPFGPPFIGPDALVRPRFPFPWWYLLKLALGTLLLCAALALVLRFGVTVTEWVLIWGIAALWVLAGSSIIGLVAAKRDEWWNPYEPMHQVLVRLAVVLGLGLMLWPSGLALAGWRHMTASTPAEEAQPALLPALPLPTSPAPAPEPVPTTCGQAIVTARRGLRLRAVPSTDAATISKIRPETAVELLCQTHDAGDIQWAHVRSGEHKGWVAAVEGEARYLLQPDR